MKLTEEARTVLNLLKHYYDISPSEEEVVVLFHELAYYINAHKVDLILKKFAKDYDIIEYLSGDTYITEEFGSKYIQAKIIFTEEFESFYQECLEEEQQAERKQIEEQAKRDAEFDAFVFPDNKDKQTNADDSRVYWLDYSEKNRKLILNNCLLIAKTNLNSTNDNFLSYIFKNPNRKISLTEVQDKGRVEIKRDFHKILDDLNFKGSARKLFFDVSKTTITFHNPVSKKQMQEAGIELLQLSDFIRNNPK